ncbi:MAG: zf-HC2 domain-containing protein [Elusimicrobia bacterium]|nr:zf-HC2 domain-containing protein [Elusimicrobiota bacterium]
MDCRQAAFKMQELLDRALAADEEELLRAHLAACAACGRAFRTFAAVARSLAGLPAYSLAPESRARILAAWAARRRSKTWLLWTSAAALAFVSCGLASGLWLLDRSLTLQNGMAALDLFRQPELAWGMLRLQLMDKCVVLGQWWSAEAAWLRPSLLGLTGGTALTLVLFAVMASILLVISLIDRVRPEPQLGRYL